MEPGVGGVGWGISVAFSFCFLTGRDFLWNLDVRFNLSGMGRGGWRLRCFFLLFFFSFPRGSLLWPEGIPPRLQRPWGCFDLSTLGFQLTRPTITDSTISSITIDSLTNLVRHHQISSFVRPVSRSFGRSVDRSIGRSTRKLLSKGGGDKELFSFFLSSLSFETGLCFSGMA